MAVGVLNILLTVGQQVEVDDQGQVMVVLTVDHHLTPSADTTREERGKREKSVLGNKFQGTFRRFRKSFGIFS